VVGVPKASKTHSLQGIEPRHHVDINIWENYNDLTATSLESWLIREIIPEWP